MPKKWVGGKGSLACPGRGQYIEAHVYDDGGQPQGTVFLEVKTLYGTGGSGRSILCNYITAADPYYRYWVGTEDGVSTTVDGTYHLCRGDPTTCQGGPGSAQVVHLGTWRVWSEAELVGGKADHLESAAQDELLKYFKVGGKEPRSSQGGGLPWEERQLRVAPAEERKERTKAKPAEAAKEDEKKLVRIARLQKELEALKASVGADEDDGDKPRGRKKTKRQSGDKGPDGPKKAFRKAELREVPRKGDDGEDESSSYRSEDNEDEDEEAEKRDERKALRNIRDKGQRAARRHRREEGERRDRSRDRNKRKDKTKGKKKKLKGKDRGPFGVAPSEDWDARGGGREDTSEEPSDSSGESSFQKAPSSKSHHLRLVRYAKRYPGRLAARLLKRMESATGFGGGRDETSTAKGTAAGGGSHVLPGHHDPAHEGQVDAPHTAGVESEHNAPRPDGERPGAGGGRHSRPTHQSVGEVSERRKPVEESPPPGVGGRRGFSPGGPGRGGHDAQGSRKGGQTEVRAPLGREGALEEGRQRRSRSRRPAERPRRSEREREERK